MEATPVIQDLRDTKTSLAHLAPKGFEFKGSGGQTTKAAVPWIAIFYLAETNKASIGMYPVYLFSSDMETIFLSTNSLPSEETLVRDLNTMLWIYLKALQISVPFPTGGRSHPSDRELTQIAIALGAEPRFNSKSH